jgi:hypothetical protein
VAFLSVRSFYFNNAKGVFGVDALSCVAADTRKIRFAGARPLRDLSRDRRHLHAIRTWAVPRCVGHNDAWNYLGGRDLRRDSEGNARNSVPAEIGSVSVSRNGLVGTFRNSAVGGSTSITCATLVGYGWNCLYGGRAIFRERTPALWSLRVARFRARRHDVSLSRLVRLHHLSRACFFGLKSVASVYKSCARISLFLLAPRCTGKISRILAIYPRKSRAN